MITTRKQGSKAISNKNIAFTAFAAFTAFTSNVKKWYDNEMGYSCRLVDLVKHMDASQ